MKMEGGNPDAVCATVPADKVDGAGGIGAKAVTDAIACSSW